MANDALRPPRENQFLLNAFEVPDYRAINRAWKHRNRIGETPEQARGDERETGYIPGYGQKSEAQMRDEAQRASFFEQSKQRAEAIRKGDNPRDAVKAPFIPKDPARDKAAIEIKRKADAREWANNKRQEAGKPLLEAGVMPDANEMEQFDAEQAKKQAAQAAAAPAAPAAAGNAAPAAAPAAPAQAAQTPRVNPYVPAGGVASLNASQFSRPGFPGMAMVRSATPQEKAQELAAQQARIMAKTAPTVATTPNPAAAPKINSFSLPPTAPLMGPVPGTAEYETSKTNPQSVTAQPPATAMPDTAFQQAPEAAAEPVPGTDEYEKAQAALKQNKAPQLTAYQ